MEDLVTTTRITTLARHIKKNDEKEKDDDDSIVFVYEKFLSVLNGCAQFPPSRLKKGEIILMKPESECTGSKFWGSSIFPRLNIPDFMREGVETGHTYWGSSDYMLGKDSSRNELILGNFRYYERDFNGHVEIEMLEEEEEKNMTVSKL